MSFNLAIMLQESVTAAPSAPMLYMGDATITYREVDDRSRRVATALRDRGLQPGDKVAVQVPNVPEFVYAYFGILRAGLT
ncbi:AMP-binding protein, partial [Gordonia sp. (in: high G+C Gram-positive bacteria)]